MTSPGVRIYLVLDANGHTLVGFENPDRAETYKNDLNKSLEFIKNSPQYVVGSVYTIMED